MVIYESKYRIMKFLKELEAGLEGNQGIKGGKQKKETTVVVCRELSKMYETVYRGGVEEVRAQMDPERTGSRDDQKGEFVVIIS